MSKPLRVLFAGTPEFAEHHLASLIASDHEVIAVLTQPDRPAGRGKKLQPSPVKRCAEAAGIEVLQPQTLKSPEAQESLRTLQPDVMVVVAYGLILPQGVLDIPRFGCLNVHASLLPRWRGAAPIQRAVEMGDLTSGVTIMQMEAGLDTGPMLATAVCTLNRDETGGSLHDRLAELGPPALLQVLNDLETYLVKAQVQDDTQANYAHKIDKAECELDWREAADQIERKVRAFNPAPVCFSYLGGERIKVWEASAVTTGGDAVKTHSAEPGTILQASKSGLLVACGDGTLRIARAQFPGGKPLTIAELLNGKSGELAAGVCFQSAESLA